VKITDFGLARAADDASLTRSGVVAGTPMYMAPEQARGEALDHRADLFSLGSVLYTMLTGHPPFRAGTTLAVLKRVAEDTPRPIREVIPEVPVWLCRIVETLHAKDPAERFQTAQEVADVLANCEAQLKGHGRLIDSSRIPRGRPVAPGWRLTRRWVLLPVAALLLAVLVGTYLLGVDNISRYLANRAFITAEPRDSHTDKIIIWDRGHEVARFTGTGGSFPVAPGRYDVEVFPLSGYRVIVERQTHGIGAGGAGGVFESTLLKDIPVSRGDEVRLAIRTEKLAPADPKAAATSFVLLARGGKSERAFASLADGVEAAESGDVIEIRGDGPYPTLPVAIRGKVLAIRAGCGSRPHLVCRQADAQSDEPLLRSDEALALEGLVLEYRPATERVGAPRPLERGDYLGGPRLLRVSGAPLHAAHCRFIGSRIGTALRVEGRVPAVELRGCEILGEIMTALEFAPTVPSRLTLQDSVIACQGHALFIAQQVPTLTGVEATLNRNTFLTGNALNFYYGPPLDPAGGPVRTEPGVRLTATGNVLDAGYSFFFSPADPSVPLEKAVRLLPRLVTLRDEHNLHSLVGGHFLSANRDGAAEPVRRFRTPEEWQKFWGAGGATALVVKPPYEGGAVWPLVLEAPDRLRPANFRLAAGSPGKGAGPGGKDPGIDADLVGPGEAYWRWVQTPAYGQWLKDSGQRDAARPADAPFAVLARDGRPERTFATVVEAVRGAGDGDTIEVRGDGPFVTDPVSVKDRALVIRAATGSRPVLAMSPEGLEAKEPLFTTNAPLTLEGLELQRLGGRPVAQDPSIQSVLSTSGPELRLAHCRLLINRREEPQFGIQCIDAWGATCELKNCEVLATGGAALALSGGQVKLRNCILAGVYCLSLFRAPDHDQPIPVSLHGNTMMTRLASIQWNLRGSKEEAANPKKVWVCDAKENIFAGSVCFNQEGTTLGENGYLPADAAAALLPRVVEWREDRNLHGENAGLLLLSGDLKTLPGGQRLRTLADWQRLWSLKGTSSLLGRVRFRGGDVAHEAYVTPRQVTPGDFALAARSPGKGAAEGGKDVGAEVDLVGPGAAYERWKKSPEYSDWRKAAGK
jgi:hypothetical protein